MLPLAHQGLAAIGIESSEADYYLGVIEQRLACRQTGAIWQQKMLENLKQKMPLERALQQLLERFMEHSEQNLPVAQWPL